MLYFSLIDILFFLVGLLIGIAIMACVSASGYEHKCDFCVYSELLEMMEGNDGEQKEKILGLPER